MSEKILFVNIIKQCNMHCDRCYLTEDSRKDSTTLEWDTLKKVLESEWANSGPIALIWEGGEASLAGKEHFTDMVKKSIEFMPHARQTMVTNMYSLPNWIIELSRTLFNSKIETTFAMNGKFNLAKNHNEFMQRFAKNHIRATKEGLYCPINLELNDHTFNLGASALIDYFEQLAPCRLEFDLSVDFESFLKNPSYTIHGYPLLPLTSSYSNFSSFLIDIWDELGKRGLQDSITSSVTYEMMNNSDSSMFGVQRGCDFLTINPDGNLTTNPLFSDLIPTFLGNVLKSPINEIIESKKRTQLIRHEFRKTLDCGSCSYFSQCSGGPSHVPTFDGSGECAGMKRLRNYFGSSQ